MNKTTKAGLYIMVAAVVMAVLGVMPIIIFGDSGGVVSLESAIMILALFASISSFTVGVVVFMIGLTLKKPTAKNIKDTATHKNTPVNKTLQPVAISGDSMAIRLYIVAGAAILVNLLMRTVTDQTHQEATNGIVYLSAFLPLELVAMIAPIASIFLGLIGAFGAKSPKLKLVGAGLILLGFIAYIFI